MTVTAASPALLHRVGDRALAWLDDHREYFRLTPDDCVDNSTVVERLKPIGELALNMRVLFREGVAGSRQQARAGQLLDFTWRELLDGGNVLARLQHDEPLSPVPLEVYATFHELGHRHPGLEAAVRTGRRTLTWTTLEMVPNRRLGVLNAERKLGLVPSGDFDEAVARTWLGQLPEPWTVQLHIGYDITHTVFHLTNWGEFPERIPPEIADYLTRYLPAWLDDWADLEHWDLLGELLVVDACLPRPTLDAGLWERYAAAQDGSGAMPIQRGMPQGDPARVFDLVHHPTLVAAFASAMATSRALSAA
ncbi:hypothetical protein SSP35_25_00580 [Streptomyces sp. NBRC 110611]|uniref:DUF6895 family protein n=1 Tax=Streptomyces sp. NBRC 110611 TaxID=1621259 RepID=UPI000829C4F0|nr:hypothetical protein [Streptomyces sp. NBRC 110611]GAU71021.1 hypothetical protein SSP35_25_00580 [Streptomyces sp. NBRC 110611]